LVYRVEGRVHQHGVRDVDVDVLRW